MAIFVLSKRARVSRRSWASSYSLGVEALVRRRALAHLEDPHSPPIVGLASSLAFRRRRRR